MFWLIVGTCVICLVLFVCINERNMKFLKKQSFGIVYNLYVNTKVGQWYTKRQFKDAANKYPDGHSQTQTFTYGDIRVTPIAYSSDNYAYVMQDSTTGQAIVVDPGHNIEHIVKQVESHPQGNIVAVLITHKHWDHCLSVPRLRSLLPDHVPVICSSLDSPSCADLLVDVNVGHPVRVNDCTQKSRSLRSLARRASQTLLSNLPSGLTTSSYNSGTGTDRTDTNTDSSDKNEKIPRRASSEDFELVDKDDIVLEEETSNPSTPSGDSSSNSERPLDFGDFNIMAWSCKGHTPGHLVYEITLRKHDKKMLFTGDVLFLCGIGKLYEGTAAEMYTSLDCLSKFPDDTLVWPGHEYAVENLTFTSTFDKSNDALTKKLEWCKIQREEAMTTCPSTIGEEKQFNPFMRIVCDEEFVNDCEDMKPVVHNALTVQHELLQVNTGRDVEVLSLASSRSRDNSFVANPVDHSAASTDEQGESTIQQEDQPDKSELLSVPSINSTANNKLSRQHRIAVLAHIRAMKDAYTFKK